MDRATQSEQVLPSELFDYQPPEYTVGIGDILYITVWDHPELTVPAGSQQQEIWRDAWYKATAHCSTLTLARYRPRARPRSPCARKSADDWPSTSNRPKSMFPFLPTVASAYGSRVLPSAQPDCATSPLTLADAISQGGLNVNQADLSGVRLSRAGTTYMINLETLATQHGVRQLFLKDGDSIFIPYLIERKFS